MSAEAKAICAVFALMQVAAIVWAFAAPSYFSGMILLLVTQINLWLLGGMAVGHLIVKLRR